MQHSGSATKLVALRHVQSSQTRSQTRVPCIGRILIHWTTREILPTLLQSPIWLSSSHPQQPPVPVPINFPSSVQNNSVKHNAGQVAVSFKSLHWISISLTHNLRSPHILAWLPLAHLLQLHCPLCALNIQAGSNHTVPSA